MNDRLYFHQRWFYNSKAKIFSLLTALFLWFYVVTDNQFDHTVDIPLKIVNMPKGWILTHPVPSKVKVLFRGSGKNLLSLTYRDKFIELNLRQSPRTRRLPITVNMIKGIPSGNTIIPIRVIEPESVTVRLDRFVVRKVPIRPEIQLVTLDGYTQVGSLVLQPDSVIVSGPRSLVSAISEIPTEKREYKNVLKEIQGKISLRPPEVPTLHYSFNSVQFRADVQRIGERVFKDIPIKVTHVPSNLKVSVLPSTLSIKLQGGVKLLARLKKENIVATIDFRSRYRYKGGKIPAMISLPEGINFSDVKPQFFELVVER